MAETKSVVEKSSRHVWECQVKSGIRSVGVSGEEWYTYEELKFTGKSTVTRDFA